jgi:cytochrome c peroxidase
MRVRLLAEVPDHDTRAPVAPAGHTELKPLRLKAVELRQLEAFLNTLSGPIVEHELPRSVPTR